MWPVFVVINTPVLDFLLCVFYGNKPALVKAFLTEPAIETLDKRVVRWLSWSTELKLDFSAMSPLIQSLRGEFSPIVNLDNLRQPLRLCKAFQHLYHPVPCE